MSQVISAIVPNYNSSSCLPTAIRSLTDQSEAFDEIIIVDDGSTDNSLVVIEQLMSQHQSIRLVRHERNQGVAAALNTGIRHAKGDYILLAAADDTYGQDMVKKAKEALKQHHNVGVICGNAIVERYDLNKPFHRTLPYQPNTYLSPDMFKSLAKRQYVGFNGGGGMLLNRQAVLAADCLLDETKWHCDWLLYFVVAFRLGVYYVDDIFCTISMRKECYSEGKNQNDVQDKVMLATIRLLHEKYNDVWPAFKNAGLLPHYAIRYVKLFMLDSVARSYMSMKLVWKLFINNAMITKLGRLFPYKLILQARRLLRA